MTSSSPSAPPVLGAIYQETFTDSLERFPATRERFKEIFRSQLTQDQNSTPRQAAEILNDTAYPVLARRGFVQEHLERSQNVCNQVDNVWVAVQSALDWRYERPDAADSPSWVILADCAKGAEYPRIPGQTKALELIHDVRMRVQALQDQIAALMGESDASLPKLRTFIQSTLESPPEGLSRLWDTALADWTAVVRDRDILERHYENKRFMWLERYMGYRAFPQWKDESSWIVRLKENNRGNIQDVFKMGGLEGGARIGEWVDGMLKDLKPIGLSNGQVEPVPNPIELDERLWDEYRRFRNWCNPPETHPEGPLRDFAAYCQHQRAVCLRLKQLWAEEDHKRATLSSLSLLYDRLSGSMGALRDWDWNLAGVEKNLSTLSSIVTALFLSVCDLQGDLWAGDPFALCIDLGRLSESFSALRAWSLCFAQISPTKPPSPACGGTHIDGGKAPSYERLPPYPSTTLLATKLFDVSVGTNFRVEPAWHATGAPYFACWADTILYASGASWLSIPPTLLHPHADVQQGDTGHAAFKADPTNPHRFKAYVTFPAPFRASPKIQPWITKWDFGANQPLSIRLGVESVSPTGAWLVAETGPDTWICLDSLRAAWIAYIPSSSAAARVYSARADLEGNGRASGHSGESQPRMLPPRGRGRYFAFDKGLFAWRPGMMVGLDSVHIDRRGNRRLDLRIDLASRDGLWVSVFTWGDTTVYSAGVVVIAVA